VGVGVGVGLWVAGVRAYKSRGAMGARVVRVRAPAPHPAALSHPPLPLQRLSGCPITALPCHALEPHPPSPRQGAEGPVREPGADVAAEGRGRHVAGGGCSPAGCQSLLLW